MKTRWLNLGLIVIATAAPLLGADVLLRVLKLPKGSERVLLLSGSDLRSGPEGYRRYKPNRRIEHAAVYGNQLAYRFHFTSNNLGLASHGDVAPRQRIQLAIVGDSFAEGQGGYSWIGDWQRRWLLPKGIHSLNLAVGGSGFGDFAVAAKASKLNHGARKLLVLFIEHDAYRPYQPMGSNPWCSFYSNGQQLDRWLGPLTCKLYGVVWHHVPRQLSDQQLIQAGLARQNHGLLPAFNQLLQRIARQRPEATGSTLKQPSRTLRYGALPATSVQAMREIENLYGTDNVLLVALPDQANANTNANEQQHPLPSGMHDFSQALQAATGLNIVSLDKQCKLDTADFHSIDNHPNTNGYSKLLKCLIGNPDIQSFASKSL